MKTNLLVLLLLLCAFQLEIKGQQTTSQRPDINILPIPVSMKVNRGHFSLDAGVSFVIPAANDSIREIAALFAKQLSVTTGYPFNIIQGASKQSRSIHLVINRGGAEVDKVIGEEGYHLDVQPQQITIKANSAAGIFYGMNTLMQLLPPGIEGKTKMVTTNREGWNIPCVKIEDYPRFGWRGLMLDVSRHFFSKTEVKAFIDQMAKYKFNTFHWHLADDQGWRIEIKGLPALTEIGAWRVPRTGRWGSFQAPQPGEKATEGGFYTQDDIREILKYAADRFITIVPEIDVPAHSLALIAAYPNLSCTGLPYPVNPGSNFYKKEDNVLCVANDSTWKMLDIIFTQIAALFPNKYIHVGGDEAYKGFWDKCPKDQALMKTEGITSLDGLQSYFEKKLEKLIISKGKKMIGWDEILEGGLAPEATVMSWRGMEGGIKAAKMGHEVVMTPSNFVYLDLYQGDPHVEPPTYSKLLLNTCYKFEPVPDGVDPKLILGGQGNLWTESIPNYRHAEYMTWPRAFAVAEALWSPKDKRSWDNFIDRLEGQFARLDAADVKYARSVYQAIISGVKGANDSLNVQLETEIKGLDVYYTFDGTDPDNFYPKYMGKPLEIPKGATEIRVVTYKGNKQVGQQINFPLKDLKVEAVK